MTWVAFVAVTVRIEDADWLMDVGLAVMLTVGAPADDTVTVAVAVVCPPEPTATAVYVVVAVGDTICVPPPG